MTENNGIWSYEFNQIVEILGSFVQKWLEDELPEELYEAMDKTVEKYSDKVFKTSVSDIFSEIYDKKIMEIRRNLEKLKPVTVTEEVTEE